MSVPERRYVNSKEITPEPGSACDVLILYEIGFQQPAYSLGLATGNDMKNLDLLLRNSFSRSEAEGLFRRIKSEREFLHMREDVGSDEEL